MDGVVQQGRHGGSARPPTNLPHFLLNHTLKVNKHTSYLSSITSDLMNFFRTFIYNTRFAENTVHNPLNIFRELGNYNSHLLGQDCQALKLAIHSDRIN